CPTGYVCENGKCVQKVECKQDQDCQKGQVCKDGKCIQKPESEPKTLAVSPANKAIKINESLPLKATLIMEDGTKKDVTKDQKTKWDSGNPFSKGTIGQYTVKATYNNKVQGTAMITVVKEKGMQDITVNSKTITVTFFDHGRYVDGDIININVNGKAVYKGITLTRAPQSRTITMDADIIVFGFTAVNEGSVPPNTATVTFSNVTKGQQKQQYTLK
ncbi:MAG: EB domain-containing protein, partial [Dissulfuribacterales bacterium]